MEEIAEKRIAICRSNVCGFHDPKGVSDKAFVKGKESCAACGCVLKAKVRSLESECGLVEIGATPLWTSEILSNENKSN